MWQAAKKYKVRTIMIIRKTREMYNSNERKYTWKTMKK